MTQRATPTETPDEDKRANNMKRVIAVLLLSIALPAGAVDWKTPVFVGDCRAEDSRRDAVRWIAYIMGLPQTQVAITIVACDPWTPIGGGATFREVGEIAMDCHDRRYWTWHIGCMTGLASGYQPGPVLLLHMHPSVAEFLVDVAISQGMSLGSRTRQEIICFWTFKHFIALAIHEYNHTKGYRHGDSMTAEDGRVFEQFMSIARFRGFVLRHEWDECKTLQPRHRDETVQERVEP